MKRIITAFLLTFLSTTLSLIIIISTAKYLLTTTTVNWFELIVISAIWFKIFTGIKIYEK